MSEESRRAIVPILLFHRVVAAPDPGDPFAVTVARFRDAMELVAASGRRMMTVSGYGAARRAGERVDDAVLVTFDDGCRDFAELAVPVLERFGVPATMYVVAGLVGRTAEWLGTGVPLMGWDELRDLADARVPVELGAHSLTHPQLDLLPAQGYVAEIRRSRAVLEDGLQRSVGSFAYPFGHHHRGVRRAVIDAGYASACAVKNRLGTVDDDVFALARVTLTVTDDTDRISELLVGQGAPVARRRELLRTKAYRRLRARRQRRRS